MIDLAAMVADLDRQIEAETTKIAETIREAKAKGVAVHDGYWQARYRLIERRRVAAIAAAAAAEVEA